MNERRRAHIGFYLQRLEYWNGLACSLEMYLGRDVLEDPAGNLIHVQWRGLLPGNR